MLKNKQVGPFEKPFRKQFLQPAGVFSIQQQFDEKYIISDLAFAQRLRGYKEGEVSQLEIKLHPSADKDASITAIRRLLGEGFHIKDRFRQNEAFFKLMQVEKWMGFAITGLTMILVAINMVGCMFMLIHEKKKDIAILKSMGADSTFIRRIFLWVGLIMCGLGMIIGTFTAGVLYILQKTVVIIPMEGFIVDAYPMSFRLVDLFATIVFVIIFGVLFAYYPANKASRIKSLVRDE
jgi:lipoprotein-releasing system permease protein